MWSEAIDVTDMRFGRLVVTGRAPNVGGKAAWLCRCECGNTRNVIGTLLRTGKTKSCGCWKAERIGNDRRRHGLTDSPEHLAWMRMRARCSNAKLVGYKNYGGRGISVCERWMLFENFLSDMGLRPSPKHSIDRINNDGNYEPSNCRWAERSVQIRNRRMTKMLTFQGQTMCVTDWENKLGFPVGTIRKRISLGWSQHDAMTTPKRDW